MDPFGVAPPGAPRLMLAVASVEPVTQGEFTSLLLPRRVKTFSFAHLQQLVISMLTRAVADAKELAELLPRECAGLREQMSSIRKREGDLGAIVEADADD